MTIKFVKDTTAILLKTEDGDPKESDDIKCHLLWGDRVKVLQSKPDRSKVRARGRIGWIDSSELGTKSLLELYFIDVGQGDGILIRMPDHRHVLVDGGFPRRNNASGKNAADFVDWKFNKDYQGNAIELDTVLCSHNDADHYGGLWDLLSDTPEAKAELDLDDVFVEKFFHAGLSWWKKDNDRTLGPTAETTAGKMFTRLISDRDSVLAALKSNATQRLQGEWAKFLRAVTKATRKDGSPTPIKRLSHADGFVPGYGPGESDVTLKILAPVEFEVDGQPAIRFYSGGTSKNTNGNSLLLRLDFDRVRVLLTGDLNTKSQHALLTDYAGEETEFLADVAKACHHGSADISYRFMEKIKPAVTVISSGDNEGHDHPRPNVVAASALTGFLHIDAGKDELVTPLVYSTELARSVRIGDPTKMDIPAATGGGTRELKGDSLDDSRIFYRVTKSGDRNARTESRDMEDVKVVGGLIYGLVNVRTDGDKILCATLSEKDTDWEVQTIYSRFKPHSHQLRNA